MRSTCRLPRIGILARARPREQSRRRCLLSRRYRRARSRPSARRAPARGSAAFPSLGRLLPSGVRPEMCPRPPPPSPPPPSPRTAAIASCTSATSTFSRLPTTSGPVSSVSSAPSRPPRRPWRCPGGAIFNVRTAPPNRENAATRGSTTADSPSCDSTPSTPVARRRSSSTAPSSRDARCAPARACRPNRGKPPRAKPTRRRTRTRTRKRDAPRAKRERNDARTIADRRKGEKHVKTPPWNTRWTVCDARIPSGTPRTPKFPVWKFPVWKFPVWKFPVRFPASPDATSTTSRRARGGTTTRGAPVGARCTAVGATTPRRWRWARWTGPRALPRRIPPARIAAAARRGARVNVARWNRFSPCYAPRDSTTAPRREIERRFARWWTLGAGPVI